MRVIKRNKNRQSTNMREKWTKNERYSKYYEKYYEELEAIWVQRWKTDLKRLKVLKKNILKLGKIPTKETQVIATVNYFVKFIDLLTSFLDNGLVESTDIDKEDAVLTLNTMINDIVARKEDSLYYYNKADIRKTVTTNNLYLGVFVSITDKDDINTIRTKKIGNSLFKVIVDFRPFSDWINGKVITVDGDSLTLPQKTLANLLNKQQCILLEAIEDVIC